MRTTTVQVAIQDAECAKSIRGLLQDGRHQVHLVPTPDVNLSGVIVVDAEGLTQTALLPKQQDRLVVLVRKGHDDLEQIWSAGVRHVMFQGDPPEAARVVVLGVELALGSSAQL